ncbi:hypothetical protein A6R68_14776 [Neotoma lepida]|uniref:TGF-beta family profile domain-containing protein n=1 Tax=Neotoma lepida TaxID=56216 RepID=A0A1A6H7W7_NEOLE|nr:hypothetical protein A6R68_14776 [Neotoma lepida]
MAAGRLMLMFLLLLSLHLGLSWGPDPQGAPVAESNKHVRLPRALAGPCQLWSLTLPVAELGLGYASEEKVIFRYCAGSCPREARTQHSLVLARLRGQGRAHGRERQITEMRRPRGTRCSPKNDSSSRRISWEK